MRADRLIALLMILQARGRVTAQALAQELEVSERTIYRDLEALGIAGVPVIAERGPGGGCSLLENYRTSLTGLTESEARALFMLHVPQPLTTLGVNRDLQSALRKLSASLPEARRGAAAASHQRIFLDSTSWNQPERPMPHLQTLYRAVWEEHGLRLTVRVGPPIDGPVTFEVAPYGLVAKASAWYLVGAREDRVRAYAVADVIAAEENATPVLRPPDFDLERFWQGWCGEIERDRPTLTVRARIAPSLMPRLAWYLGRETAASVKPMDVADDEWSMVEMTFGFFEDARTRLLGLGGAVEVIEPLALRLSLRDFAEQAAAIYARPGLCPAARPAYSSESGCAPEKLSAPASRSASLAG